MLKNITKKETYKRAYLLSLTLATLLIIPAPTPTIPIDSEPMSESLTAVSSIRAAEVRAKPRPDWSRKKSLTPRELKDLLYEVGFRGEELKTAWAIVMRESNGRPRAYNGNRKTGDSSYGLFQINMIDDLGVSRRHRYELESNDDLFHPKKNARIAYRMSNGGRDFGAWAIGPNSYREDRSHDLNRWLREFPDE